MLSQFFILSERGDTLAFRNYRGDVVVGTPEIFHRRLKAFRSSGICPPPIFNVEGTQFIYIIQHGLYFVCTSIENIAPVFALEFLQKISMLCKDYCGIVNEDAVRYNFALIYEILDEVLDFGYPQCTSTDELKEFIFNEPHPLQHHVSSSARQVPAMNLFGAEKKLASSSASQKSVMKEKNEVFIDVLERLTVVIASTGQTVKAQLDGSIKVRSFLAGSPEVRLDLSDNLRIRNWENQGSSDFSSAVLDDCSLHECVQQEHFERNRVLLFSPPVGEWVAMRYSIFNVMELPFQVNNFLEQPTDDSLVLRMRVRCDAPPQYHAVAVIAKIPVPKQASNVLIKGTNLGEYKSNENFVTWNMKRIVGGNEQSCSIHIKLPDNSANKCRKEIGPVRLTFEFPSYVRSGLKVKSLKVIETNGMYTPSRWIRYITHSDSYEVRI